MALRFSVFFIYFFFCLFSCALYANNDKELVAQSLKLPRSATTTEECYDIARSFFDRKQYKDAYFIATGPARKGHAPSQYLLGEMCFWGKGVPKNLDRAEGWLFKSVVNGYTPAFKTLAMKRYSQKEYGRALPLFENVAIVHSHDPEQLYNAGLCACRATKYKKARDHLTLSAALGNERASLDLGTLWLEGLGGEQDTEKALSCFKNAAESGEIPVRDKAVQLLQDLAQQGSINASYQLAAFWGKSQETVWNALACLEKAERERSTVLYDNPSNKDPLYSSGAFATIHSLADDGNVHAMLAAGRIYERQCKAVEHDTSEGSSVNSDNQKMEENIKNALFHLDRAAKQQSSLLSEEQKMMRSSYAYIYHLRGGLSSQAGREDEAVCYFRKAVEYDSAEAKAELGSLYFGSQSVKKCKKGICLLQEYIEQAGANADRSVVAQLGKIYYAGFTLLSSGLVIEKNYIVARDYLERAAQDGDVDSMYRLGCIYRDGCKEIPQDIGKAKGYFISADQLGNRESAFALGEVCYAHEEHDDARDYFEHYVQVNSSAGHASDAHWYLGMLGLRVANTEQEARAALDMLKRSESLKYIGILGKNETLDFAHFYRITDQCTLDTLKKRALERKDLHSCYLFGKLCGDAECQRDEDYDAALESLKYAAQENYPLARLFLATDSMVNGRDRLDLTVEEVVDNLYAVASLNDDFENDKNLKNIALNALNFLVSDNNLYALCSLVVYHAKNDGLEKALSCVSPSEVGPRSSNSLSSLKSSGIYDQLKSLADKGNDRACLLLGRAHIALRDPYAPIKPLEEIEKGLLFLDRMRSVFASQGRQERADLHKYLSDEYQKQKKLKEARHHLELAASFGHLGAKRRVGLLCLNNNKFAHGLRLLKEVAREGDAESWFILGNYYCCRYHETDNKGYKQLAEDHLKKAVDHGCEDAQATLNNLIGDSRKKNSRKQHEDVTLALPMVSTNQEAMRMESNRGDKNHSDHLEKLVERDGDVTAICWFMESYLEKTNKDYAKALNMLSKGIVRGTVIKNNGEFCNSRIKGLADCLKEELKQSSLEKDQRLYKMLTSILERYNVK